MRFFLIDKIIQWEIGKSAKAIKNISLSEDFFDDHFPRMPIMPGVLILEGMAQLSGIFIEETIYNKMGIEKKALMSIIDKTKFKDISKPGDQLIYSAEITNFNDMGGRVRAKAYKNEQLIVSTSFTFIFSEIDDEYLKRDRKRLLELWLDVN